MATFRCTSSSCAAQFPLSIRSFRHRSIALLLPTCSSSTSPLSFTPSSLPSPLRLRLPSLSCSASPSPHPSSQSDREEVFFDGGPHIGDLITNLVFGLSLLWLPLTLASVFRALFLRYRFTNLRVTVLSGLTGSDRKDFSYNVIKDVKYVPRFVGEWGDVVITLSDGTQVELKSVPKFKEIAQYCLDRAGSGREEKGEARFKPGQGIATRS